MRDSFERLREAQAALEASWYRGLATQSARKSLSMRGNRKQSLAISRFKALRNNLIYRKKKLRVLIEASRNGR